MSDYTQLREILDTYDYSCYPAEFLAEYAIMECLDALTIVVSKNY